MDVYLVRHAIAWERDPVRWPGDRDRPLTNEGIARFRAAAAGISRIAGDVPGRVLSSPLARAWQTALLLADVSAWPAPEPCPELEPDANPLDVLAALAGGQDAVALVGHEPGLGEISSMLLAGNTDTDFLRFKKGGAAKISISARVPSPGSGDLHWLMTPKALRALG